MTRGYLAQDNSDYFYTGEPNMFHWKRIVGVCGGRVRIEWSGKLYCGPSGIHFVIPFGFYGRRMEMRKNKTWEGGNTELEVIC